MAGAAEAEMETQIASLQQLLESKLPAEDAEEFGASDLRLLVEKGRHTELRLQMATVDGLQKPPREAIIPFLTDILLAAFNPSALQQGSAVSAKHRASVITAARVMTEVSIASQLGSPQMQHRRKNSYRDLASCGVLAAKVTNEVVVEGHPCPLVLEEDERLDLSPLQLQPATIVIQGKGGLVGRYCCTKRHWASLLQVLGKRTDLGTAGNPLQVTGAAVSGCPLTGITRCSPVTKREKLAALPALDWPGLSCSASRDHYHCPAGRLWNSLSSGLALSARLALSHLPLAD